MKKNKLLFIATLFIMFASCDTNEIKIVGNYELLWIDVPSSQSIYVQGETSTSSLGVGIEPYIFSVGHDNNFIIAKQHPTSGFEGSYKVDTTVTNYYIINMKLDDREEYKVIGPMSLDKFNNLRHKFNIENIEFDMIYPEIPN